MYLHINWWRALAFRSGAGALDHTETLATQRRMADTTATAASQLPRVHGPERSRYRYTNCINIQNNSWNALHSAALKWTGPVMCFFGYRTTIRALQTQLFMQGMLLGIRLGGRASLAEWHEARMSRRVRNN